MTVGSSLLTLWRRCRLKVLKSLEVEMGKMHSVFVLFFFFFRKMTVSV